MKTAYPAFIKWSDEDAVFEVTFPDLSGCITYGPTLEEAQTMAADALTGILESMLDRAITLPTPSVIDSEDAYLIAPAPSVAFAAWLRAKRKASGMTLTDVADKLGVKYQVYQKLENPETANPTLKTMKKLEKVFGEELVIV
jgi:antitoxin HicB